MKKFLMGFVFSALVFSAFSGSFPKALNYINRAKASLQKGNSQKAVEYLNLAIMAIKNKAPLVIKNIHLCDRIGGFGNFVPKPENAISKGEPFLLYFEVDNFGVKERNGLYYIDMSEDARLMNEKGKVIFQRKDWTNLRGRFPSPSIPVYFQNRITGIPPGKYRFEITVNDRIKRTFVVKTYDFEVR